MNKHKRLAIIIAPFLAIGGYIATDYYQTFQADKKRLHTLAVEGSCDINQGKCLLKGAGLILEYSKQGEMTNLESNVPLVTASIGMKSDEMNKPYDLNPDSERKNWKIATSEYFKKENANDDAVRLIVMTKGHVFFSEFSNSK